MPKLKPVHPGEILREEFMIPLKLNPHKLALALRVPAPGVYEIVKEKRAVSMEMALRLARFFSTTPEFWVNLQAHFDLETARDRDQRKVNREGTSGKVFAVVNAKGGSGATTVAVNLALALQSAHGNTALVDLTFWNDDGAAPPISDIKHFFGLFCLLPRSLIHQLC